ncbi:hypothetical protein NPIL_587261, partial [Nephila pilipes]
GVMIGFISSLCFSLIIGIMGMMKAKKRPSYHRSTDACPGNNSFIISNYSDPGYSDHTTYENWTMPSQISAQEHVEE